MENEEQMAAQRYIWRTKFSALNEEELKIFQSISASEEQLKSFNENAKGPLREKQNKLTTSMNGPLADGKNKTFNLLLLGKTGSGKSATGNLILGKTVFDESMKSVSQTKTIAIAHCDVDDAKVIVIDTPGFNDTNASQDEVITEMSKVVDIFKEGIHGVLFVYSLGNPRYTAEEQQSFQQIQDAVHGDGFINNCFVILTHGDELVKKQTLQKYLDTEAKEGSLLGKLLTTLKQRVIVVDNSDTTEYGRQLQREQLVRMVAAHSEVPCQPEIFKKFLKNQEEVTNKLPPIYRPHAAEMERVVSDEYMGIPHQQIMSMNAGIMANIIEKMVSVVMASQERQTANTSMIAGLVKQQEAINSRMATDIRDQRREMSSQRDMKNQQAMNAKMVEEMKEIAKTVHDSHRARLTDEENRKQVKEFSIPILSTVGQWIKKGWNALTGKS